jgi:hypothetical protein
MLFPRFRTTAFCPSQLLSWRLSRVKIFRRISQNFAHRCRKRQAQVRVNVYFQNAQQNSLPKFFFRNALRTAGAI